ncbi:hypothetical protein BRD01_10770 [Halobacteriales archaeon QS_8_65_32]|nr:MAG: hypothetical protein BRD01_10770 [Halobacteriales archaeon QS_8_65_32]
MVRPGLLRPEPVRSDVGSIELIQFDRLDRLDRFDDHTGTASRGRVRRGRTRLRAADANRTPKCSTLTTERYG